MTTVLFVKANNRPAEQAVSVKLYEAFLASYKESHPNDTVVELDLYNEELPYVGVDMINGTFNSHFHFSFWAFRIYTATCI